MASDGAGAPDTSAAAASNGSALDCLVDPAGLTAMFTCSPAALKEMRSSSEAYEVDFIFSSIWPMRARLLPCLLSPPETGSQEVEEVLPPSPAVSFASRACASSTCCFAWFISMVMSDDCELLSGVGDVTHGTPNTFFATHECALPLMER